MSLAHDCDVIAEASVLHRSTRDPDVAAALHDLPQALELERLRADGRLS